MTEGYAADWTMAQLREACQRIDDRIDELTMNPAACETKSSRIA